MRHPTTPCLPNTPRFDPWLELYFRAEFCPDCFGHSLERIEHLPVEERGDGWAVAARAWMRGGAPAEAVRAWERAEAAGGREVDGLAIWVLPDGLARAEARARQAARGATRADRWCDVAALRLLRTAGEGAAAAIAEALAACPDHLEAHHWLRFLALPDAAREACRREDRPSRRGRGLAARDADRRVPTRANGWVSPRRIGARLTAEAGPPTAPLGSALARLDDAGVTSLFLATADDYRECDARDPLARDELDLARLADHVEEERPAGPLGRTCWSAALASADRQRVQDVAEQVCALSTRAVDLLPVAADCADWLASASPRPALFRAYGAWIAAARGERDAAARARAVLDTAPDDELVWRLAVGALFRLGDAAGGAAHVAAARLHPRLRRVAATLEGPGSEPGAPRVLCSPRLVRRTEGAREAYGYA
jgi:hypothetical protein